MLPGALCRRRARQLRAAGNLRCDHRSPNSHVSARSRGSRRKQAPSNGLVSSTGPFSAPRKAAGPSIIGVLSPPVSGPPQHIHHREDENFVLHSGRYGFWLDGDIAPKGSGETVFVPRGREHTYRVARTVPSRHLTVLTPGGLEASSKPWRLMGTAFPKTCRPSRHAPDAST